VALFKAWQGRPGSFSDAFLYDVIFTDRRLVLVALVRWGGGLASAIVHVKGGRKKVTVTIPKEDLAPAIPLAQQWLRATVK